MLLRCCDLCKATPAEEYRLATGDTQVDTPSGRIENVEASVDLCDICAAKMLKHLFRYKSSEKWLDVQAKSYRNFVLARKLKI